MMNFFSLMRMSDPTPCWTERAEPQPWDPKFKFTRHMFFQGNTYPHYSLFDVEAVRNENDVSCAVYSPNREFGYRERILPACGPLQCMSGQRRGEVAFDTEVCIPQVYQVQDPENPEFSMRNLWMSFTPNEVMTLRPGTRFAKGHTVIGGLGLGYQLIEVANKSSVKRITLVERSQEIVDWILPRVRERLPDKPFEVVVGDINEVLPEMEADVALVDIWKKMGGAAYGPARKLREACTKIGRVWCWGETNI